MLANILRSVSLAENDCNCELFLRRFSQNGALTYDEYSLHDLDFSNWSRQKATVFWLSVCWYVATLEEQF